MSEKELKSIKIIKLEIKRIQDVLYQLNNSKQNSKLKEDYIKLLQEAQDNLLKKKIELEEYIRSIDDAEIRLILALRFIDLRSWNYISRQLHYDRSTVYLKFKKFIQGTFTKNNI